MGLLEEFKEHMFRPMEEEFLGEEQRKVFPVAVFLGSGLFMIFMWFGVNFPEMLGTAMVYAMFVLITLVSAGMDYVMISLGQKPPIVVGGVVGRYGISTDLTLGVLLAGASLGLSQLPLQVPVGMKYVTFIVPAVFVPIAEEMFFGGVVSATSIRSFGIFTGTLISAFWFSIFHLFVSGLSLAFLVWTFLFRVMACLSLAATRSIVPGMVAHILVNTVLLI